MAVGLTWTSPLSGDTTFAERWDGHRWSVQRTPNPASTHNSSLVAVSCSSATSCTAVGVADNSNLGHFVPLVEHWDGHRWAIQHVPHRNNWYLYGISCSSDEDCVAVGLRDSSTTHQPTTLAERWDGTRWSVQRTAQPAAAHSSWLYGVSCASSSACTAVGFYYHSGRQRALAERWNGHDWSVQDTPDPAGGDSTLQDVSCSSARACSAVGEHATSAGGGGALAERWDGHHWSLQTTPDPQSKVLYGISCPSAHRCMAAGVADAGLDQGVALAEQWNASQWATGQTRRPAHIPSELHGVSCPSPMTCFTVGNYGYDHGPYTPLVYRYS